MRPLLLTVPFFAACFIGSEVRDSGAPDSAVVTDVDAEGAVDGGADAERAEAPDATVVDLHALREKPIFALTRAEASAVCQATRDSVDVCAYAGLGARTIQRCEYERQLCRDSEDLPDGCEGWPLDTPFDAARCVATVEQYTACERARFAPRTCEQGPQHETLQECLAFEQACPFIDLGDPGPTPSPPDASVPPAPACDPERSPLRVDESDDLYGLDRCRPRPTRMVALGDSIAACFRMLPHEPCASEVVAEHLREQYAPGLRYASYALNGARTADLLAQAQYVEKGPGHVLVWIFVGGNDLLLCARSDTESTRACVDDLLVTLPESLQRTFAYFNDRQNFPDGATFVLNTQYSPWDQCHHPANRVDFAEEQIRRVNQAMLIQPALERDDVVTIDHFPDWVGHGLNANDATCPHCYKGDNSSWMLGGDDRTHPNATGQQHIADKAKLALDLMVAGCPESALP